VVEMMNPAVSATKLKREEEEAERKAEERNLTPCEST
jgi:hypothetical protein